MFLFHTTGTAVWGGGCWVVGGGCKAEPEKLREALTGSLQSSWEPAPRWEWKVILIKLIPPKKPQNDVIHCLLISDSCEDANTNSQSVVNANMSSFFLSTLFSQDTFKDLPYGTQGGRHPASVEPTETPELHLSYSRLAQNSPAEKKHTFPACVPIKLNFSCCTASPHLRRCWAAEAISALHCQCRDSTCIDAQKYRHHHGGQRRSFLSSSHLHNSLSALSSTLLRAENPTSNLSFSSESDDDFLHFLSSFKYTEQTYFNVRRMGNWIIS